MAKIIDYDLYFHDLLQKNFDDLLPKLRNYINEHHYIDTSTNLTKFKNITIGWGNDIIFLPERGNSDHFISEIIKAFPYNNVNSNLVAPKVNNFVIYILPKIKREIKNSKYELHYSKEYFKYSALKLLNLLAKYYSLKKFQTCCESIVVVEKLSIDDIINTIKEAFNPKVEIKVKPIVKEEIAQNQSKDIVLDSDETKNRVIVMAFHYMFKALGSQASTIEKATFIYFLLNKKTNSKNIKNSYVYKILLRILSSNEHENITNLQILREKFERLQTPEVIELISKEIKNKRKVRISD